MKYSLQGIGGVPASPLAHPAPSLKRQPPSESNTSNTNVAPSRSFLLTLLSTLSTPPCLSSSVFVLQLDIARIPIRTEKTPETATIVPSAPTYAHSLPQSISSLSLRRPYSLLSLNHATFRGLTLSSALLRFSQSARSLLLVNLIVPAASTQNIGRRVKVKIRAVRLLSSVSYRAFADVRDGIQC